jgi:signal transduction histidine kinase
MDRLGPKKVGVVPLPVANPGGGTQEALAPSREADLPRSLVFRRWHSHIPVVLVGLLGALVTWAVFSKVNDLERQRQVDAFSEAARHRLLVIQREVAYSLGVVQDVGGFFDVSRRVSRRQFREFVGPALKRNREVEALLWAPRVTVGKRGDFVSRARGGLERFDIKERNADGSLVSASERPVHFPVLYAQPHLRNEGWLGLDLASEKDRWTILNDAAVAKGLRTSLPGPAPTGSGEPSRFTVYLPVYEREAEEATRAVDGSERRPAKRELAGLRGFAIGLFLVRDLVEQALANLGPGGVDIYFYSSPDAFPDQLFYVHSSRTRTSQPVLQRSVAGGGEREYRGEIQVGDRQWTVICGPVPGYFEQESWSGYLILGGGTAFTLLSVVFLVTSRGRAEQVRRLVAQRTLELERSNTALNNEIAERRRAEQALQLLNVTLEQRVTQRTAEAERRARELEQFAYVASHDLKAPLRAIGNLAGWLKEDLQGKLTAETGEQIDLLRDRVARMHALVDGLLAYSRIGRTAGSQEEVDTAALVADTVDLLAPPNGFEVKVKPGMPTLCADKLHLGQVFANLIGNAINHHDRRRGIIRVSGEDLNDHCEFVVEDDGPGIPAEYRDKVFMMFQTLEVKDYGRDTGIGLALVKKLIEEHGGTVNLDSGPERGCRFSFSWIKQELDADSMPGLDSRQGVSK